MAPPPHPIRDVDLYREPNGELGIAWVTRPEDLSYMGLMDSVLTPGAIQMEPLDEYLEARFGKNKGDESKRWSRYYADLGFVRPEQSPWPIPDKPEMALKEWEIAEALSLLDSVAQFFGEHVRLRSDDEPRGVAAWILTSSIPEIATHAPPLIFSGIPGAGKSRAIRAVHMIARRGLPLNVPSSASLYALSDAYKPTLCVDEWANLSEEVRRPTENIIRAGFAKGGKIPRRKDRSEGVRFYDAFCFFALASRVPLPDDIMDRGFPFYMVENRGVPDLPETDPEARELRTMILRYRLEALSARFRTNPSDLAPFHRSPASGSRGLVREAALKMGRSLSDRGLDKAETLADVATPFDAFDDVVSMILLAAERGRDTFADTTEAFVFRALKRLAPEIVGISPNVSLAQIHDEVWRELGEAGMTTRQLEIHDPVLPRELGPMVRGMGIRLKRAKIGWVVDDLDFWDHMKGLEPKYGGRTDEGQNPTIAPRALESANEASPDLPAKYEGRA